jgi:hypothetical protein
VIFSATATVAEACSLKLLTAVIVVLDAKAFVTVCHLCAGLVFSVTAQSEPLTGLPFKGRILAGLPNIRLW